MTGGKLSSLTRDNRSFLTFLMIGSKVPCPRTLYSSIPSVRKPWLTLTPHLWVRKPEFLFSNLYGLLKAFLISTPLCQRQYLFSPLQADKCRVLFYRCCGEMRVRPLKEGHAPLDVPGASSLGKGTVLSLAAKQGELEGRVETKGGERRGK